jgi:2-dehydropantoate 2-reductase
MGPETAVLTLQNGLGNIEAIGRALHPDRALGGTTSMGATVLGVNHIRHAGWGETVIGEPGGEQTARATAILERFRRSDLAVSFTDNLPGLLWSKLIINVGINALTALTRLHNGELLDHEGTRAVMEMAVDEAMRVARARGVRLLYDHPVEKVAEVCQATAGNISSMLQDVLKEKKTEIEQINGAVVREAAGLDIHTPVNATLVGLIKALEESYEKRIQG